MSASIYAARGELAEKAAALLKQYPDASSLSLGRMLKKKFPLLFKDVEYARARIRYIRGAMGKRTYYRKLAAPSPFTSKVFSMFPAGLTEKSPWGSLQIEGKHTVGILQDAHIPYHDTRALLPAIDYIKDRNCDIILLNGDIADFYSCSRWETDPLRRDLPKELKTVREFLATLRKGFPKARIIYKLGNHEERWRRFIISKAPEVYGVDDFEIEHLLRFGNHGIELVKDKRPIRLGDLNVIHGHEYRFSISNPVNAARGIFLRCKAYVFSGHFHQNSHHSENNVEGNSIAAWSGGCLCELHPDYAPLNNWSHGVAVVEMQNGGKFHMHNKVIKNGQLY